MSLKKAVVVILKKAVVVILETFTSLLCRLLL